MIRIVCAISLFFCFFMVSASSQERQYTDYEIERFELNKKFTATVLTNLGDEYFLKEFKIGKGLLCHKLDTGNSKRGVLLPLSNIRRIIRKGDLEIWVDVIFLNGSEMHTTWAKPEEQKILGILEDGSPFETTIGQVREIEIQQIKVEG